MKSRAILLPHREQKPTSTYTLMLGKNLRILLKKNNISVAVLCRTLRLSAKTIYAYTYGVKPSRIENIQRIADYFQVSLTDLLFRNLEMTGSVLIEKKIENVSIEVAFFVRHERDGKTVTEERTILLR